MKGSKRRGQGKDWEALMGDLGAMGYDLEPRPLERLLEPPEPSRKEMARELATVAEVEGTP
jgi:hypothetical protein